MPRKLKNPESQIVSAIFGAIDARYSGHSCVFLYRNNNIPVFDKDRGVFRAMPKHSVRGTPDIIGVVNGRPFAMEVKTEKGRQSEHQKEFEGRWDAAGGVYEVVRSPQDALDAIARSLVA